MTKRKFFRQVAFPGTFFGNGKDNAIISCEFPFGGMASPEFIDNNVSQEQRIGEHRPHGGGPEEEEIRKVAGPHARGKDIGQYH